LQLQRPALNRNIGIHFAEHIIGKDLSSANLFNMDGLIQDCLEQHPTSSRAMGALY
jgi:hypothetical protein